MKNTMKKLVLVVALLIFGSVVHAASWTEQTIGINPDFYLRDVHFVNDYIGWVMEKAGNLT